MATARPGLPLHPAMEGSAAGRRVPLLVLGMVSLVAGTLAGLAPWAGTCRSGRGPAGPRRLMVCAFFRHGHQPGTGGGPRPRLGLPRPRHRRPGDWPLLAGAPASRRPSPPAWRRAVLAAASLRIMPPGWSPHSPSFSPLAAGCWLAGNPPGWPGPAAAAAPAGLPSLSSPLPANAWSSPAFSHPAGARASSGYRRRQPGGWLEPGPPARHPVFAGAVCPGALVFTYDIACHNAG